MVCKDNSTEKKQRMIFQICCKVAEKGNQTQGLELAAICAGDSKGDGAALQPRLSQRMLAAHSTLEAQVQTEMAITRIPQEHKIRTVLQLFAATMLAIAGRREPWVPGLQKQQQEEKQGRSFSKCQAHPPAWHAKQKSWAPR